ncbi:GNAT family N-acetyltransferase [Kribbella sandramycini]|uniref:GNAT family N-acetyltransferase n=1 Tax=Kribbella sandramycini TaxID=60450 RepID=A0A7Y4P0D9_9ACTN|nr:GNAT family N-acetyltransferase [Kribbella sandramycini]MBB6565526.1 GNAT superfamily N-acetyltransferase [Kribbella sandramycini]NOL41793.1 GNAT family N-acetyltransferase [Kribbella sandramycini]
MIDDLELRAVPSSDPTVLALATAQQAELAALYGEDQPQVGLHPEIALTLLLVAGTPVGCVGLQPVEPGLGEIKRMYVEPASRGWGLSRILLRAVEDQARAAGLTRLRLETGTRQREAVALYTNHGYLPTPPYPPFENEPESLCYAKDLGEVEDERVAVAVEAEAVEVRRGVAHPG